MKTGLLVLAAGMGSRFGGVKQVEAVGPCGEAILEYSIFDAIEAGFDDLYFLVRKEIEPGFRERILSRLPASIRPRLAFQEIDSLVGRVDPPRTKPWGTGHALLCAAGEITQPFAVINADDYYGRASLALVHGFLEKVDGRSAHWCMAGFRLERTMSPHGAVSRGLCQRDSSGRLASVQEHPRILSTETAGKYESLHNDGTATSLDGGEIVSMNLWGFTPAVFGLAQPLFASFLERSRASGSAEFYLPALVDSLVAAGRASVEVLETTDSWFGLTWKEDISEARSRIMAMVEGGFYPSPLWSRQRLGFTRAPKPC